MRGAGGITPAKVNWGNKGTTEEGAKLTRAKDAVKLGERGPSNRTTSGTAADGGGRGKKCCRSCLSCFQQCCGAPISKLRGYYAVIASYRPVLTHHGTAGRRVLCCPGRNTKEKVRGGETTENLLNAI